MALDYQRSGYAFFQPNPAGIGMAGNRAPVWATVRSTKSTASSVDDEAATEWKRALYDARLNRRESATEAVRTASLDVLKARRARGTSQDIRGVLQDKREITHARFGLWEVTDS